MSSDPRAVALDAGNEVFHQAYGGAREGLRDQVPILVLSPTELSLHHQGRRHGAAYSCASFGRAKSASHIAVALFALTCGESGAEQRRADVARLLGHIQAALDAAPPGDRGPLDQEIEALLQRCAQFAGRAREAAPSQPEQAEFASDVGPRILHITDLATSEQIAGLHEAVEVALHSLSPEEQEQLQVVVLGDHQARARSLGMQYFKRRLREAPGADRRVTYGENIDSEEEAISLVATRRLDKRIALAFFGDEHRLQRDVLGDAAQRCLDQMHFPEA